MDLQVSRREISVWVDRERGFETVEAMTAIWLDFVNFEYEKLAT